MYWPNQCLPKVFSYKKKREISGNQFLDFQKQKINVEDPNEVCIDLAEHESKGKDRKWSEEGSCSELCRLWLNCYWALEQAAHRGCGISILGVLRLWLDTWRLEDAALSKEGWTVMLLKTLPASTPSWLWTSRICLPNHFNHGGLVYY